MKKIAPGNDKANLSRRELFAVAPLAAASLAAGSFVMGPQTGVSAQPAKKPHEPLPPFKYDIESSVWWTGQDGVNHISASLGSISGTKSARLLRGGFVPTLGPFCRPPAFDCSRSADCERPLDIS
jgi:hypothetical protein